MNTSKLKTFGQQARRHLLEQVQAQLLRVLDPDSAARRESLEAVHELERQIEASSEVHVVDRVAYIWFNCFCALRFMDVRGYNCMRVVSANAVLAHAPSTAGRDLANLLQQIA